MSMNVHVSTSCDRRHQQRRSTDAKQQGTKVGHPRSNDEPHDDLDRQGDPYDDRKPRRYSKRPKATIAAWVAVAIAVAEVVVRLIERP